MILIFLTAYNLLYIFCEYFFRKYKHREVARKIAHIGTGLITYFSIKYLDSVDYTILFGIFLVSFFLIRRYTLFSFLDEKGRGFGDIYFILGQLFCILFLQFDPRIAGAGLLILAFADGLAPFGRLLQKREILQGKSYGGSFLFFGISSAILMYIFGLQISMVGISLLATIGELFGKKGNDNLIIPVIICVSLRLYEIIPSL